MKSLKKGFTLVELMVVIVIIGILAALAIPRFMGATNKTKVSEFKPVLKQLMVLQESYYQERNAYTAVLADLAFEVPNANTARFTYSGIAAVRGDNVALGKATYIPGKGIIVPTTNKELLITDAGCIDVEGDIGSTADLAALANTPEIGKGLAPTTCP